MRSIQSAALVALELFVSDKPANKADGIYPQLTRDGDQFNDVETATLLVTWLVTASYRESFSFLPCLKARTDILKETDRLWWEYEQGIRLWTDAGRIPPVLAFVADRLEAVKWRDWKLTFYEETRNWFGTPNKLTMPKLLKSNRRPEGRISRGNPAQQLGDGEVPCCYPRVRSQSGAVSADTGRNAEPLRLL